MIRYLIRERLSFTRFLDLELEGPLPDARASGGFRPLEVLLLSQDRNRGKRVFFEVPI